MLLLLLPLASLLPSSSSDASADGFDHFVLALQWPGTVCRRSAAPGPCCSENACCRSDPIGWFTIHGLWPSYARGNGGPTCCDNPDFDMAKISNLTTELDKYWPSLYCGSPSLCSGGHGSLWAHELCPWSHETPFRDAWHGGTALAAAASRQWEKHGTCSYPVIQDEYGYFSAALHLYSTYNVTAMLASKISMGGGTYPVTDVIAAIKESSFGASLLLLCDGESLQELRLCFDKDLEPLDCKYVGSGTENGEVEYRRSCPRYISLPAYKPHGGGGTSGAAARRTVASGMLAFFVAF